MNKILYFLGIIIIIIIISCCVSTFSEKDMKSRTVYYGSFRKSINFPKGPPIIPIEEISKDDALRRNIYYIGYYNDEGKLSKLEKYEDLELVFRSTFNYFENGNIKDDITINAEGEIIIYKYDIHGQLIQIP